MKCFNCGGETNPTLLYCGLCGVPLETDVEDIARDEERRRREMRELEARRWAKGLFVLALFLLGCVIATRAVLLTGKRYDAYGAFRVPAQIVSEQGGEPPASVEVDTLSIPFPE